ncbi:IS5 family transposase [Chitinimonas sp. BJB300]|nr:IS5 family transposase [Chitinimonas sp. BJB300]TSJ87234.1 IS5 family transposase [Chitinimonas sp. BJB300]
MTSGSIALPAHRRHDISDSHWLLLEPHLPGRRGDWGRGANNNRLFINAVFWILRTGAPWRDLLPDLGGWKNTHRRFCRWRDKGVWRKLLEQLITDPDVEWLMIDASHIKVHPDAAGACGGNQAMGVAKGGFNSKLHLAVDAHGMPIRILLTSGTTADCTQASTLIEGLTAQSLLMDRGYDSDAINEQAHRQGMQAVVPPRKHRKVQREYDKDLYRHRHLVEKAFLQLKRRRGIATRYAKNMASFLAAAQIRCMAIWIGIL